MGRLFVLFLFLALILSCSKQGNEEVPDMGYDYFPLETGKEWVYDVDSFRYDNNSGQTRIDTFHFYYKENVGQGFTGTDGRKTYFINRFFTDSLNHPWITLNTWTASRDNFMALKSEENILRVKLVFPLGFGKTWKENLFNNLDQALEDSVNEFGLPFTANGEIFAATLKVKGLEEINFIEEDIKYERYAKGIGMVYSLHDSINTQAIGARGYRYRFTLHSHN